MNVSSTDVTVKNKITSRSSVGFDWKTNCFICSKQALIDIRHKDRDDVQEVRTLQIRANVLRKCNQRNDEFAHSVHGRLHTLLIKKQFITGHAIKSSFLMKAKATQLAGLLMMIQTMDLINFVCG